LRYVLDASVAVASLRPNETHHAAAVAYLSPLLRGVDEIVVPSLFAIEVASALGRAGFDGAQVSRFLSPFLARARLVTIGAVSARQIWPLAVASRLRAADAVYVWLASRRALPLVTSDKEVHQRAASLCQVIHP
jgi:predicted nucleic acid-binding protein